MVALGSVPRRCGQLCSLLGPRPGPEERDLLLGFRDRGLEGSPEESRTHSWLHDHVGPAPHRGPDQGDAAETPQPRLRSRPIITVPHAAHHTPPGPRAQGQAGLGLSHPEPADAERGRQIGPRGGLIDRPTDRYASEPTELPQKDSYHHKGTAGWPPRKSASARTGRELQLPGAFAPDRQHTPFPRGHCGPYPDERVAQASGKCSLGGVRNRSF